MTMRDLIIKLEECRSNMESVEGDLAQDTHNTLNDIISEIENDGIESNEYYTTGKYDRGFPK